MVYGGSVHAAEVQRQASFSALKQLSPSPGPLMHSATGPDAGPHSSGGHSRACSGQIPCQLHPVSTGSQAQPEPHTPSKHIGASAGGTPQADAGQGLLGQLRNQLQPSSMSRLHTWRPMLMSEHTGDSGGISPQASGSHSS